MLKEYCGRQLSNDVRPTGTMLVASSPSGEENGHIEEQVTENFNVGMKLDNTSVLANLSEKLKHLSEIECVELEQLILEHFDIFPDVPSRTTIMNHEFMM